MCLLKSDVEKCALEVRYCESDSYTQKKTDNQSIICNDVTQWHLESVSPNK